MQSFDFVVGGVRGNDVDLAPDDGLTTFGAPTTTVTQAATLQSSQLPKALAARAGKVLRVPAVAVQLSDGSVADPDSETCALKYNGRRIASLAGGCAWKIPKAYKNGRVVLTVTVSYGGKSSSKTETLPVH